MQPVLDGLALGHRDHVDGRPGLIPRRDADDVAILFDNMPAEDAHQNSATTCGRVASMLMTANWLGMAPR